MHITDLLSLSVENNASDLHISTGVPPMIRVNGDIKRINLPEMSSEEVFAMISDIMNDHQRQSFQTNLECDFSFELPHVSRFRVNVFNQRKGPAAAFRVIPSTILSLEALQTPAVFKSIANMPRGLVLVTGPTGSGKSTTLAAMIDYINSNKRLHILTIEDTIEFIHESKQSLVHQRELYLHTQSFENALRCALREDPDVIMVGEMRDIETIRLALTAAETGHLVFGTLHTTGAAKTIDRIVDVFSGSEKEMVRSMLSESLKAVISQILLKTKEGDSRVVAFEIMIGTPAIRNLIRENKIAQMTAMIQTGQQYGMQTLDQCLTTLVRKGLVSVELARTKAQNPQSI